MIDTIGQIFHNHMLTIGLGLMGCFLIIGAIAEHYRQERERQARMASEVDNYDPEEPVGM